MSEYRLTERNSMCNAYKYRFRTDKKNGAEDIAKAEWYESKLIELNSKDK